MASPSSPVPVTIIAGSFGSGKTTLCNQLLETCAAARASVAVISHRFAEESLVIDDALQFAVTSLCVI